VLLKLERNHQLVIPNKKTFQRKISERLSLYRRREYNISKSYFLKTPKTLKKY
jgi:hypothetical protein